MPNLANRPNLRTTRVLLAAFVMLAGAWGYLNSADGTVFAQSQQDSDSVSGAQSGGVVLIRLDGPIDGVSARFIERGLNKAVASDSRLVVLMLDTPGGLLDATRDIVETILASEVPVAVYVAPDGAQAASAGTFLGAAADILAMAPTTNIGAASVVSFDGSDLPDTLSRKASEDAAAFLRSIAERRGRNISALEATVLDAKAYSASEAVDLGIADLIADDYKSLLELLDGYEFEFDGEALTLDLSDVDTETIDLTLLERILSFISNPNIAFLLISLGGLGVIVELWHPGLWIPGTLGVLFLVLGWAGVGQLPFSWAGVALIGLSLLLFYLESTAPGIGYFGIAGTIVLILGGVFLVGFFGSPAIPGDAPIVSRWLLVIVGVAIGGIVLWFASELRKAKRIALYQSPTVSTSLVGATGVVTADLSPSGGVMVGGEYWTGENESGPDEVILVGTDIQVVSVDGNHLRVRRFDPEEGNVRPNDVTTSE